MLEHNSFSFALTLDQRTFFQEQGYLVIEHLVQPSEVEWMIPLGDPLFSEHPHPDIPSRVDDASRWVPQLLDCQAITRMAAIAEQLLGMPVLFLGDFLLDKKPGDHETIWHQDVWRRDRTWPFRYVEAWLAINDTDKANGCIQVVPKSQTQGIISRSSEEFHTLTQHSAILCEVPGGSCIFWDGYTLHYAGLNTSGKPRRAYSLTFGGLEKSLMADFLLETVFGSRQSTLRKRMLQQILPVSDIPGLTLNQLLEDPLLFRRFLSEPAGQLRLKQAVAGLMQTLQVTPGAEQKALTSEKQASLAQRQQAQNRYQKIMRERLPPRPGKSESK